ncbi:unnamed protein product [Effrenium voratum]|uniref:Histone-lysine N-methyltransferase, H3 lysine-79 specific n=1 Tax=Effrenium voratum TaxID=2562239 RepID=A0AA36HNW4_9DINO|nr:unnamed protein product [Effrenium voratum]|mmetsp:Transcript_110728/g.264135  ORF Transcript_110728/g.264135 Transcript_110728/m.264135 type:complete len:290 (+) Transcript_110728:65-934(+)
MHKKSQSHQEAVSCLQKVFAKNSTGFGSDSTEENVDVGNLQYGEVTYGGMEPLYSALDLRENDVFYDLGCGVGKLVLYVALRGQAQRSVGLEVGERRFLLAEGARNALEQELESTKTEQQPCSTEYKFQLADISRYRYLDPTVAVLTNLCMDMGVQSRTLNCLLRCPSFRRLVCITPMPHSRLKLVRSVMVSCTWAKMSAWQVYDVLPPQEPLARSWITGPAIKRSNSNCMLKRNGEALIAQGEKKDAAFAASPAVLRKAKHLPRRCASVKRSVLRPTSTLQAEPEPAK